jgi:hypothetical protein
MPVALKTTPFQTLYGGKWAGTNDTLADFAIDDAELSYCINYVPDVASGYGWMIKREGLTATGTAKSATSRSIFGGHSGNYHHCGTDIFNFAGASLATVANAASDWDTYRLTDGTSYDIFAEGTNILKTTNGTTFTNVAGPATARSVGVANNFCYMSGHDGGKLRWGDLGTLDFNAVNELDVQDPIVGQKEWNNGLLVLCQHGFGMVFGTSTVTQNISYWSKMEGCAGSIRSLAVTPFGAFWWTHGGLVWCKSDFSLTYPMMSKSSFWLKYIKIAASDNEPVVNTVWDGVNHRVICNMMYSAGAAGISYFFYPEYNAGYWCNFLDNRVITASGTAATATIKDVYLAGQYIPPLVDAQLYKLSGNTDAGTAITAMFETKRDGNPGILRQTRNIILTTNLTAAATITYSCLIDGETTPAIGNDWAITIDTGLTDTLIGVQREHYRIKHRITDFATTRTRILALACDGYIVRLR